MRTQTSGPQKKTSDSTGMSEELSPDIVIIEYKDT